MIPTKKKGLCHFRVPTTILREILQNWYLLSCFVVVECPGPSKTYGQ